jgi:hypothetical protein
MTNARTDAYANASGSCNRCAGYASPSLDRKDTNNDGAPPHTVEHAPRVSMRQPIDHTDHGRSHVGTASGPDKPRAVVVGCGATVPTQIVQLFPGASPLVAVPAHPVAVAFATTIVTLTLAL